MARAQAIGYQVSQVIKQINGIGTSKLASRNSSSATRSIESGHRISPKTHSIKSITNLKQELTNLGKYCKHHLGIKNINQIDDKAVRSWLNSKNIGYRTMSNYLSNINKVHQHLNITREQIKEIRDELSPVLRRPAYGTRAYIKLGQIKMPDRSIPAYRLQKDYGLRVGAATKINLVQQLKESTLHYQEKGGKWSQKVLDKDLVQELIKNAQNGVYSVNSRTYSRDLQKAIEKSGQKFNGTHGIRHTYAQHKLQTGYTKKEVSQEMGHQRGDVINVYMR